MADNIIDTSADPALARGITLADGTFLPDATGPDIVVTANNTSATSTTTSTVSNADWRVRLAIASGANYLYKSSSPGILKPLLATDGVIFPYTPSINVSYSASYEPVTIPHSNYKVQQYTSSSVDSISITGEFTAQDVFEAQYVLAVIHFFQSATKMFYGQDVSPKPGTPPAVCFLYGLGAYQFAGHPLGVSSFTYSLPNDVDYIPIPASTVTSATPTLSTPSQRRLAGAINQGGTSTGVTFATNSAVGATWIPSKIQISIGCVPLQSRNQISNNFSLENYASGNTSSSTGVFW